MEGEQVVGSREGSTEEAVYLTLGRQRGSRRGLPGGGDTCAGLERRRKRVVHVKRKGKALERGGGGNSLGKGQEVRPVKFSRIQGWGMRGRMAGGSENRSLWVQIVKLDVLSLTGNHSLLGAEGLGPTTPPCH